PRASRSRLRGLPGPGVAPGPARGLRWVERGEPAVPGPPPGAGLPPPSGRPEAGPRGPGRRRQPPPCRAWPRGWAMRSNEEVEAVATFYTMLKLHPCGRYVISVCTNPSCSLLGGRRVYERAKELLGPGSELVSEDGLFTLEEEECLAACDEAPVVALNYVYY